VVSRIFTSWNDNVRLHFRQRSPVRASTGCWICKLNTVVLPTTYAADLVRAVPLGKDCEASGWTGHVLHGSAKLDVQRQVGQSTRSRSRISRPQRWQNASLLTTCSAIAFASANPQPVLSRSALMNSIRLRATTAARLSWSPLVGKTTRKRPSQRRQVLWRWLTNSIESTVRSASNPYEREMARSSSSSGICGAFSSSGPIHQRLLSP
jgi:hypothetical protein